MQSGTRSRAFYRPYGDPAFAPVGETEVINGVAAMSASGAYGPTRVCAGIISYADMRLGARLRPVLEAHIRAGGDRLRGIRDSMAWDASTDVCPPTEQRRKAILTSPAMREALACFAPLGLIFEMWVYHPQMNDAIAVMRDFPDTQFVLDHLGGPLHTAPHTAHGAGRFAEWRTAIRAVAKLPNVVCKLGGIGMHWAGFDFHLNPEPPSSQMICDAWRPYIETCIEAFGPGRCMMESNFPVDKAVCSYAVLWNAMKRMAGGASASEKAEIFSGTARRVYRLPPP
jgi:predicted TIM-barrel fold metal-dependent hydrolase